MSIGRSARRAAVALVAALSLTVLFSGAASASDDWLTGFGHGGSACSNGTSRWPQSEIHGAVAWTDICWSGTNVSVLGWAEDTASDGYCAFDSIRYQVFVNGSWSGWQYRRMATACGVDTAKTSTWWWSIHPTRNLQMRACRSEANGGVKHNCDPTWH